MDLRATQAFREIFSQPKTYVVVREKSLFEHHKYMFKLVGKN